MGNQSFEKILVYNGRRFLITKRLYQELIANTNGKEYRDARVIVHTALRDCEKETKPDRSSEKVDFEI
jgi:hypothetical protein